MVEITLIICATFLAVLVVYWIMPTKKMEKVNRALISLLQILPISKIVDGIMGKGNETKTE